MQRKVILKNKQQTNNKCVNIILINFSEVYHAICRAGCTQNIPGDRLEAIFKELQLYPSKLEGIKFISVINVTKLSFGPRAFGVVRPRRRTFLEGLFFR